MAVHWAVFKDFGVEKTTSSELDKLGLPPDLRLKLAQFDPTDFKGWKKTHKAPLELNVPTLREQNAFAARSRVSQRERTIRRMISEQSVATAELRRAPIFEEFTGAPRETVSNGRPKPSALPGPPLSARVPSPPPQEEAGPSGRRHSISSPPSPPSEPVKLPVFTNIDDLEADAMPWHKADDKTEAVIRTLELIKSTALNQKRDLTGVWATFGQPYVPLGQFQFHPPKDKPALYRDEMRHRSQAIAAAAATAGTSADAAAQARARAATAGNTTSSAARGHSPSSGAAASSSGPSPGAGGRHGSAGGRSAKERHPGAPSEEFTALMRRPSTQLLVKNTGDASDLITTMRRAQLKDVPLCMTTEDARELRFPLEHLADAEWRRKLGHIGKSTMNTLRKVAPPPTGAAAAAAATAATGTANEAPAAPASSRARGGSAHSSAATSEAPARLSPPQAHDQRRPSLLRMPSMTGSVAGPSIAGASAVAPGKSRRGDSATHQPAVGARATFVAPGPLTAGGIIGGQPAVTPRGRGKSGRAHSPAAAGHFVTDEELANQDGMRWLPEDGPEGPVPNWRGKFKSVRRAGRKALTELLDDRAAMRARARATESYAAEMERNIGKMLDDVRGQLPRTPEVDLWRESEANALPHLLRRGGPELPLPAHKAREAQARKMARPEMVAEQRGIAESFFEKLYAVHERAQREADGPVGTATAGLLEKVATLLESGHPLNRQLLIKTCEHLRGLVGPSGEIPEPGLLPLLRFMQRSLALNSDDVANILRNHSLGGLCSALATINFSRG